MTDQTLTDQFERGLTALLAGLATQLKLND
jgi:hypothetical protein